MYTSYGNFWILNFYACTDNLIPTGDDPKSEELSEVDSGRPVSRQSLQSGDLGGGRRSRQMSITLDKFTGDSLLHFSYSAVGGGAGGMLSESTLGKH